MLKVVPTSTQVYIVQLEFFCAHASTPYLDGTVDTHVKYHNDNEPSSPPPPSVCDLVLRCACRESTDIKMGFIKKSLIDMKKLEDYYRKMPFRAEKGNMFGWHKKVRGQAQL